MKKTFWNAMLIVSILFFTFTLFSNNFLMLLSSLAFAFLVRVKGNPVIFTAYNQRRREKIKQIKKMTVGKNDG
jgi:hypothetical protein